MIVWGYFQGVAALLSSHSRCAAWSLRSQKEGTHVLLTLKIFGGADSQQATPVTALSYVCALESSVSKALVSNRSSYLKSPVSWLLLRMGRNATQWKEPALEEQGRWAEAEILSWNFRGPWVSTFVTGSSWSEDSPGLVTLENRKTNWDSSCLPHRLVPSKTCFLKAHEIKPLSSAYKSSFKSFTSSSLSPLL